MLGVSEDGRSLEFQRATDEGVQRVDVLAVCGPPKTGEPRVRIGWLGGSVVDVTFGLGHCDAQVSLVDLSVRRCRCD